MYVYMGVWIDVCMYGWIGGDVVGGTTRPGHQTGRDRATSLSLQLRGQRGTGGAPGAVPVRGSADESSLGVCALQETRPTDPR